MGTRHVRGGRESKGVKERGSGRVVEIGRERGREW